MNQPTPFQKWFDSELARQGAKWDDFNTILLLTKIIAEQTWNAALDAAADRCEWEGFSSRHGQFSLTYAALVRSLKSSPISDSSEHAKPALADRDCDGPDWR